MLAGAEAETMLVFGACPCLSKEVVMNKTSLFAVSLALGSTLLKCGGDQKPAAAPEPASSLAQAELPPAPVAGPDAGAAPTSAPPAPDAAKPDATSPDALTDPQIA